MRIVFFYFFLFLNLSVYCQNNIGVFGIVKPSNIHTLLYKKYDSTKCRVEFSSFVIDGGDYYFVIGDYSCQNDSYKNYIIYHKDTIFVVESNTFTNTKEINSSLKSIKINTPDINDRIKLAPKEIAKFELEKLEKEKIKLEEEKRVLAILESKNIVLIDWSWKYPNNYSISTDISFSVINPYKKKIKYIWFTFRAFNPVEDVVRDGITGKIDKTVQGIGPIEYMGTGSYAFENVFYSKVISGMRITQIKIQFFDGSIKVIQNPLTMDDYSEALSDYIEKAKKLK